MLPTRARRRRPSGRLGSARRGRGLGSWVLGLGLRPNKNILFGPSVDALFEQARLSAVDRPVDSFTEASRMLSGEPVPSVLSSNS
ncbi:hypothetical protein DY000_02039132 [Brassica cretica]|uniref:Uncharacterized protein n=1 Tax=Brassica cretica TaxID=69181 RepID=A0ABQ7BHK4_BRACR|nr:hypothetical protein DY000_02039132 [Brassica cretica]